MRLFLQLKHWQLFIIYVSILFLLSIDFYSIPHTQAIQSILSMAFFIVWNLMLGLSLRTIKPKEFKINATAYVGVSVLFLSFIIFITIISPDGPFDSFLLNMTIGVISVAVLIYIASFPSKVLRSLELEQEAKPAEYGRYIFEFLIVLVGVWLSQPRINEIYKKYKQSNKLRSNKHQ